MKTEFTSLPPEVRTLADRTHASAQDLRREVERTRRLLAETRTLLEKARALDSRAP